MRTHYFRSKSLESLISAALILGISSGFSGCFSKEDDAIHRAGSHDSLKEHFDGSGSDLESGPAPASEGDFRGITTVQLPEEAIKQVVLSLPVPYNGNSITRFNQSIRISKANLPGTRDSARMGSASAAAMLKLAHGGCDSTPDERLRDAYGIAITQNVASNANTLKAVGIKLLENSTGILRSDAPALFAKLDGVFEAQIAELIQKNASLKQAWNSVCTAALTTGFALGI